MARYNTAWYTFIMRFRFTRVAGSYFLGLRAWIKMVMVAKEQVMSYACVCNAKTTKDVQACIDAGATTFKAVIKKCGVGNKCGACHDLIRSLIKKKTDK